MTTEEWRRVPFAPQYEVSDHGRVRSWRTHHGQSGPRVLKNVRSSANYRVVNIVTDGRARTQYVHQLVMLAFVGPRPDGQETRHLDGDPTNNVLTNLAYGTQSENMYDRVRHGTHHWAKRTHCLHDHAFTPENTGIRKDGRGRFCIACKRVSDQHRRDRKRAAAA